MTQPYKGAPQLKQLPATKPGYKGRNMNGGRKAVFSQSKQYKIQAHYGIARPWPWEVKPHENK